MGTIWCGIWWTCPWHFSDGGNRICRVPTHFLYFAFGEVSNAKVMFVTFCVMSFSSNV